MRVKNIASLDKPSRFGPTPGTLTLTRSGDTSSLLTVAFSLSGSARYNSDYTLSGPGLDASTSTVTFAAGARNVNLTATPTSNSQPGQSIGLTIVDGTGYVPGTPVSAGLTIDGTPPPPWLVLLYLAGDDIDPTAGGRSLTEFLAPLPGRLPYNPNMRLVVLYDGNVEGDSAIYVREQSELRNVTAEVRSSPLWLGGFPNDNEFNSGAATTLQNFIRWARDTYPGSPQTMLSIVDHGGGWAPEPDTPGQSRGARLIQAGGFRGMSFDWSSGDSLSTRDTGEVFSNLGALGRFDLIFYDACLMGMVESAYEVAPYTDYLIAGENLLWSSFPYEEYFDPSRFTATTTSDALANLIIDTYNEPLARDDQGIATDPFAIAAINTAALPDLANAVRRLAIALLDAPEAEGQIRSAYAQAQKFDYDASYTIDQTDGYVDLADLAKRLADQLISAEVSNNAQAVVDLIEQQAIINKKVVSGAYRGETPWSFDNASGLAIYLPLGERDCRPTGLLRTEADSGAKAPCTAPIPAVDDPIIEPQLDYYARPQQLRFTADVPEWAQLLQQLDRNTPTRIEGKYGETFPAIPTYHIYLPMVLQGGSGLSESASNLEIVGVQVLPAQPTVGQPTEIQVTIRNSGQTAIVASFWVDLYIDPLRPPEVNTIWSQISATGASWRVYGLAAGETRVLSTRSPNDPQRPGENYSKFRAFVAPGLRQLYVLVDSYTTGAASGAVDEQDESDNRVGPLLVEVAPAPNIPPITRQPMILDQRRE